MYHSSEILTLIIGLPNFWVHFSLMASIIYQATQLTTNHLQLYDDSGIIRHFSTLIAFRCMVNGDDNQHLN